MNMTFVPLLERAGFALSRNRNFEVIVERFIQSRRYDIFEINQVLLSYDQKENWSVLKYVGRSTGGIGGFTHGRYYYWPCSVETPEYEGVIDDEEFTSYIASIGNASPYQSLDEAAADEGVKEFASQCADWEIVEDSTGMAARILHGKRR